MHPCPLMGSKGGNKFLTENGNVTYQSMENDTYNNMQAIFCPYRQP